MSEKLVLSASLRKDMGKGASRRLRKEGLVPAIVYGGKREPVAITFEQREIQRAMKFESFYSQIITVTLDKKVQQFVLRDIQRHPYKVLVNHLDFERVSEDKEITVHIPIHYLNQDIAKGVKDGNGVVSHHLIDIEITCLPAKLPEYIELDLTNLELDETIHLSDIKLPEGVTSVALSHGDDKAVVSISIPKAAPLEDEELDAAAAEEAEETGEAGEETSGTAEDKDQGGEGEASSDKSAE